MKASVGEKMKASVGEKMKASVGEKMKASVGEKIKASIGEKIRYIEKALEYRYVHTMLNNNKKFSRTAQEKTSYFNSEKCKNSRKNVKLFFVF